MAYNSDPNDPMNWPGYAKAGETGLSADPLMRSYERGDDLFNPERMRRTVSQYGPYQNMVRNNEAFAGLPRRRAPMTLTPEAEQGLRTYISQADAINRGGQYGSHGPLGAGESLGLAQQYVPSQQLARYTDAFLGPMALDNQRQMDARAAAAQQARQQAEAQQAEDWRLRSVDAEIKANDRFRDSGEATRYNAMTPSERSNAMGNAYHSWYADNGAGLRAREAAMRPAQVPGAERQAMVTYKAQQRWAQRHGAYPMSQAVAHYQVELPDSYPAYAAAYGVPRGADRGGWYAQPYPAPPQFGGPGIMNDDGSLTDDSPAYKGAVKRNSVSSVL